MRDAALVFTLLVLLTVSAFVWMNRASSLVVGAALPALVGIGAALALVFVFNRPEAISHTFPVVFAIERASGFPIFIPNRPFPMMTLTLADGMWQKDSTVFDSLLGPNFTDGVGLLYHEFLQKAIVDDLAMHQFGTWRMKTERFIDLIEFRPTSDAASYKSKILSPEELERLFEGNRFARAYSAFGKWALPPSTTLAIERPKQDPQLGQVGRITLKNRFCDVTINTRESLSKVGLGNYTLLAGISIDEAQEKYWTVQYITSVEAKFSWYLLGHPDMPIYRQWVNAIVDELTFSFDEQSLWERAKESFLLRRHVETFPPLPAMDLGPIRSAPKKNVDAKTDAGKVDTTTTEKPKE